MRYERCKTLTGITAKTKSGVILGKLVWVEIDRETGKVEVFGIAAKGVLPRLLDEVLTVGFRQVILWTEGELVVDDAVVTAAEAAFALQSGQAMETSASFKDFEV